MSGQPIRAEGAVDPAAVESLGERMAVISERRGPVIGLSLLVWLVAARRWRSALGGGRSARAGGAAGRPRASSTCRWCCCSAPRSSRARASNSCWSLLGAPLLAALTLASLPAATGRWRSPAALTVLAYAIDVIAGSPLTSLSLLGPEPRARRPLLRDRQRARGAARRCSSSPAPGRRWPASRRGCSRRARCASPSSPSASLAAFVFAAGRFGADVGAAIVLPVGAAVAAAAIAARRRRARCCSSSPRRSRRCALLALVDLVSGANAHLTRSVLDAGGLDDLADVAQRRLQLSAHSFARPIVFVFLPLLAALAVARAALRRDRLARLAARAARRCAPGLLGAAAATVSAPSPTTPAPCCSRSAPPTCSSSPASPGPSDRGRARTVDRRASTTLSRFVRIALVSPYSWTYQGGVNRHVEALAEEFLGRGHDVRVLAPFDPPGRLSRVLHRAARRSRARCPTT